MQLMKDSNYMNRMTALLNKIEHRLGTKPLNLPEKINKDHWATDVICNETLDTFSRFFPNKMLYYLTPDKKKSRNIYLIDEHICESVQILGCGDINWAEFSSRSPAYQYGAGIGTFDLLSTSYDAEDIMMVQQIADHSSLFTNGIYPEYIPPNVIKLSLAFDNAAIDLMQVIPINLYIRHANNLMTIEPTKMEIFEKLSTADVATYLFQYLKHYDGVETVFASTDLKLNSLEEWANTRNDVVEELKNSYVSPSNKNMPVMYTIN